MTCAYTDEEIESMAQQVHRKNREAFHALCIVKMLEDQPHLFGGDILKAMQERAKLLETEADEYVDHFNVKVGRPL